MGKRIILLSDGTGNAASKVWRSNVWRIFESLDLTGKKQVAFYDDGVGTSSFKPLAILGGVFGYGLKRNVLDIYKFLCANYESPDDEIYGFGFSRGAFTIRVVIGLVLDQGLVHGDTDAEFYKNAKLAYRAYRGNLFHTVWRIETPFRWLRDAVLRLLGVRYDPTRNRKIENIKFLGLWDTVAAYGLPIDEMARGVSKWLFPLELPNRHFNPAIEQACHALSLDDERTTFHPVLWNEKDVPPGRLHQVWFAGVHSNVGGGYPDDSLAHIPLYWIMQRAAVAGLKFKTATSDKPEERADPDMVVFQKWLRDKDGRLYDSRNGLSGYYRYGPRKIDDLNQMTFSRQNGDEVSIERAKIHETAINRAKNGAHRYAPIGIPRHYDVLNDTGLVGQDSVESTEAADARCAKQEGIWNVVWRRRVIYFATVLASMYLVIYPFFRIAPAEDEFNSPISFVSQAIRLLQQVLPGFMSPWMDAYARAPGQFLFVGILVAALILTGSILGGIIESRMELVWRTPAVTGPAPSTPASVWVRRLAALVGIYLLFYAILPPLLQLPEPVHRWIAHYITFTIRATLVLILLSMLPAVAVLHLRSAPPYRAFVRNLKLRWLPAFFALFFVYAGLVFGSHVLFNLEDSAGYVCDADPTIAANHKAANDYGVSRCVGPEVATCSPDGMPTCGSGRPAYCGEGNTPICELAPKNECATDKYSAKCFANAVCRTPQASIVGPATCAAKCEIEPQKTQYKTIDIAKACNATHVVVEQGRRYIIKITPGDWLSSDRPVTARGVHRAELDSRLDKIFSMLTWPLTRNLMQPRFVVFARVGSTGNDEYLLEPDVYPKEEVHLEVAIIPRQTGELFLYVNERVLAWPSLREFFYGKNKGTAIVEVRNVPK
jgi:Uncharacterized alpha/beta hydrolase domain (DUF2235)